MGVLCDWQIQRDVKIEPFSPAQKRPGLISYGVTSMGYDVRLGYKFKRFRPYPPGASGEAGYVIDPKNFNPEFLEHVDLIPVTHEYLPEPLNADFLDGYDGYCRTCRRRLMKNQKDDKCESASPPNYIIIPPNSFVLGESMEHFTFPRDVMCLVVGKSTNARCGLIVNVTPGEPDWQGVWTIELSNTTPLPMKVYAGEGIMQCVFLRSDARYELGLAMLADLLALCQPIEGNQDDPGWKRIAEMRDTARRLFAREPDPATGKLDGTCEKSYADKGGKYQDQGGLTTPRVDGLVSLNRPPTPIEDITLIKSNNPIEDDKGNRYVKDKDGNYIHANGPNIGNPVLPGWTPRSNQDVPDPRTGNAPAFPQGKPPGQAELDAHLSNPNAPGPEADKNSPWKSPDGSIWHYSFSSNRWVQATEPTRK